MAMSHRAAKVPLFNIADRRATTGDHFYVNFDGLRAVAALMVLVMHLRTIPDLASGAPGVWLFFGLSGFLLYSGFLAIPELSSRSIIAYIVRRVFRILPLYVLFVLTYAHGFKQWEPMHTLSWSLAHIFFLSGDLHLWTIRAEIVFYLLLPFVVVVLAFIRSAAARFVALLAFAAACMTYWNDNYAMFFIGMAAVHGSRWISGSWGKVLTYASLALILVLSTFNDFTAPLREALGIVSRAGMYGEGPVFFPLCFLVVAGASRFDSRLLGNRWLRVIGVCGFGVYLWHPLVIEMVRAWGLSHWVYQATVYALNIGLAVVTYVLIEKPGIDIGRRIARWVNTGRARLGFRPAAICLLAVGTAFGIRAGLSDSKTLFEVYVFASRDSMARLDLYRGEDAEPVGRAFYPLTGEKWHRMSFVFWDRDFDGFTFDPGPDPGQFRLKNFRVKFPLESAKALDLSNFQGGSGTRTSLNGDELAFWPENEDGAVRLTYRDEDLHPWLTATRFSLFMSILYFAGFLALAAIVDRLLPVSRRWRKAGA